MLHNDLQAAATSTGSELLRMRDVTMRYGARVVIDSLSLDVKPAEKLAALQPAPVE